MTAADRSSAVVDIARLEELADIMLPAAHGMPSASEVGAVSLYIDEVLGWRSDLRQPLAEALAALDPTTFTVEALSAFLSEDEAAYAALTTVVAACYYLSPVVRDRIGYPGQVAKTYDPFAYTEWVADGLLDPVVERGPIWREAPG